MTITLSIDSVRFVRELYPRLRENDAVIEKYRTSIDKLPPIVVARDGILVDGYHRWRAHKREGSTEILAENLGNLSDAEILRESISRNAAHGYQLSQEDKKRLAGELWLKHFAAMDNGERTREIMSLLSVSERIVNYWTRDARTLEEEQRNAQILDLWLNCLTQEEIAAEVGVTHKTISNRLGNLRNFALFTKPPGATASEPWGHIQHFDIWQVGKAEEDENNTIFGRMPAQIVENLLWFYTEPGDIVIDPFAGGGTTIDVAKAMGRRVWASDLTPRSPMLPIHQHDICSGWPGYYWIDRSNNNFETSIEPDTWQTELWTRRSAPNKAKLILLDPPYWQQAKERYSNSPKDLANMSLDNFYLCWNEIITICSKHIVDDGYIAYIISPTQCEDKTVVDHATDMLPACWKAGLKIDRRIIVPYQTQQATGQQVTWARDDKRMLKLYRDLVVLRRCPT